MYRTVFAAAAVALLAAPAQASDSWTLAGDQSKVAYASIKKDTIGEINHFTGLTGKVSADGAVEVAIDLTSVETFVDIRNERMIKYVFDGGPTATLTADLDMDALNAIAPGDAALIEVEGQLAFGALSVDVYTDMFVARLGEDRVMVTTDEMIMVEAAELEIDSALDKLMELAKLPGITRVAPVTLRLMFNRDVKKAEAAKPDQAG